MLGPERSVSEIGTESSVSLAVAAIGTPLSVFF